MSRIPIPAAVKDYNKHMGGVDLSDALIGYYNVLHKTTKWYKTFFLHFVDIAVVNSFILHQHLSRAQNKSPFNQKEFREKIVSELAALSSTSVAPDPPASTSHAPEPPASTSHASDLPASAKAAVELCCPEYFGSDARSGRRVCALCKLSGLKVKTSVYCTKCSVPLCLVASRICFRKWDTDGHSQTV